MIGGEQKCDMIIDKINMTKSEKSLINPLNIATKIVIKINDKKIISKIVNCAIMLLYYYFRCY